MQHSLNPKEKLSCLLVHPKFSLFNYWNFVDISEAVGAKANQPPLGLLTVAALLPQHWDIKVIDLNVREISDDEWKSADIIATGGMLPQQKGALSLITKAKQAGKFVVVGGPDPTSQPEVYEEADALVLGEGEITIPIWLESLEKGDGKGMFSPKGERPDVTKSPIPRFELIDFGDYLHLGIQFSRGCPFNCEFCDIIELYGRKPRIKTVDQFLTELNYVRELGYTGWIDIVDDNFIGNKRKIKNELLPALKEWGEKFNHPFFYSTEASMNLGDDLKLLQMMKDVDFRYVFIGIETPDPDLLMATQKSQNVMRSMEFRVKNIYDYGISIAAGFIVGFDNEKKGMDTSMIRCIEDLGLIMSMVGLLVALPGTQLTRRLIKEQRLLTPDGKLKTDKKEYKADSREIPFDIDDQTTGGLNYITTRDRIEILDEYKAIVSRIYSAESYFKRVFKTTKALNIKRKHKPNSLREIRQVLRGFLMLMIKMTLNKSTRTLFWKDFFKYLFMGPEKFEFAMNMLTGFIHFEKQTGYLVDQIESRKEMSNRMNIPRSLSDVLNKVS